MYEINIFWQTSTIATNPLNNQIAKPEALIQRIFLTALALVLAVLLVVFAVNLARASDPYIKTVLSLDGDPVVSGETPPMPKFQPNPQEMVDLLSFLESL